MEGRTEGRKGGRTDGRKDRRKKWWKERRKLISHRLRERRRYKQTMMEKVLLGIIAASGKSFIYFYMCSFKCH